MKPRHAAALSLVGWYLLVPPVIGPRKSGSHLLTFSEAVVPLSQWTIIKTFDSADECEKDKAHYWDTSCIEASPVPKDADMVQGTDEQVVCWAGHRALCLSTDDPRLKEK